ncbi:MAG: aldolase/citrate lyase family protein [Longimicrobiales bacterium]
MRNKLRAGESAGCVKLNLADPRVAEIAAMCGFDSLWLDMEHVPNSIEAIENQIRAAKVYDVDTIVRTRRGSYSDLILPLEMGAAGIMVPHVMGVEDAKRIAWQTRFHPIGRRALDGGNGDGAYCGTSTGDYIAHANLHTLVIVQIEDPEPMQELDEIAAVDGIDMLFFGPGDFSQGIGVPGVFDDPRIPDARQRIADAARRHGKFAGTVGAVQSLPALNAQGYQFVSIGADVLGLREYFGEIASAFGSRESAVTTGPYRAST